MKLDDLRFNDSDVRRILELARKRERDRISAISTDYDSAATYQDLMKVTEERGLSPAVVREVVENQEYKANRLYEAAKDNAKMFIAMGIGGFAFGLGVRYFNSESLGITSLTNTLIAGAGITLGSDAVEFFSINKRNIRKTLLDDIGTFAGGSLGYFVASLA